MKFQLVRHSVFLKDKSPDKYSLVKMLQHLENYEKTAQHLSSPPFPHQSIVGALENSTLGVLVVTY